MRRCACPPGQQSKLLLQHDLQLLSLLGEPVVHAVVAVAVLQHQPEIRHKLCDGVVLLARKLLLHPLQTHGLPQLRVAPPPDAADAALSLQVAEGDEEGTGDPLVLVQEERREYPIGLLDLVVHVVLEAGVVGGDADLGQGEVTARYRRHAVVAQLDLVPDSSDVFAAAAAAATNALSFYHSSSGTATVTQRLLGEDREAGAFTSAAVPLGLRRGHDGVIDWESVAVVVLHGAALEWAMPPWSMMLVQPPEDKDNQCQSVGTFQIGGWFFLMHLLFKTTFCATGVSTATPLPLHSII